MPLASSQAPTQTTPSGSRGASHDPLGTVDCTCPDPCLSVRCSLGMSERSGEASLAQLRWGHGQGDTRLCDHTDCEMITAIKLMNNGSSGLERSDAGGRTNTGFPAALFLVDSSASLPICE